MRPIHLVGKNQRPPWKWLRLVLLANTTLSLFLFFAVLTHTGAAAASRHLAIPASVSCTDSWVSPVDGNWIDATKWSAGVVPGASDNACVTVAGTYTVTISAINVTIASLTLGVGASGTQTLAIQAKDFCSGAQDATVTAASGATNGATGAITLTHIGNCDGGTAALIVSPGSTLTNSGTIVSAPGVIGIGRRNIQGNLTTSGAMVVNGPLNLSGASTFSNTGTINVSSGQILSVVNGAILSNVAGGVIDNNGTLAVDSSSTFNQGAGATNADPIQISGTLDFTGSGASSFLVPGGSNATVGGSMVAGQSLTVEATDSCSVTQNATATTAAGFADAGSISLTHAGLCSGGTAALVIPPGSLVTNSGAIVSAPSAGNGIGVRSIQGNLVNSGRLAINVDLSITGAGTLTNSATITIATGQTLNVVNGAALSNASGGVINNSGTVAVDSTSRFDQGAGSTNSNPIQVSGTLNFTGSGAGSFLVPGGGNATIGGTMAAAQSLTIEATDSCGGSHNATATAAAGFAGAGSITLTHAGLCSGGTAELFIPPGRTVTNSGIIISAPSTGTGTGSRSIQGNLTFSGTLTVNFPLSIAGAGTFTNAGSVNVPGGQMLNLDNGATLSNAEGGVIDAIGTVVVDNSSTFNQGAGSTNGNPVQIMGTLNFTGSGASNFLVPAATTAATLDGTMALGQTVTISAGDGQFCAGPSDAAANAAPGFAGVWTITLTHFGTCGGSASLAMPTSSTLVNRGTIVSCPSSGSGTGTRSLKGNLTNAGTIAVNFPLNLSGPGTVANSGTVNVGSGQTLNVVNGATMGNALGGVIINDGTIAVDAGSSFNQSAGSAYRVPIRSTTPGTGFGQLTANGHLGLSGNLVLANIGGFAPSPGETFQIITCATCSGGFADVKTNANYQLVYSAANVIATALPYPQGLGAPTNLTALPGDGEATLTWSPPASDGGSPVTSYTVSVTPSALLLTVSATTPAATVSGLINGTAYTFTVSATNGLGTGLPSSQSSPVTPTSVAKANAVAVLPAMSNQSYGGYLTVAYLENFNPTPAHVLVRYFDQVGHAVGKGNSLAGLPYWATWTLRQDNADGLPAGQAGSAIVYSDQPLAVFVNEFAPGNASDATSYSGIKAPSGTGPTLYAPAIARNAYGGYTTGIGLINAGSAATDVQITYRDGTGNPIKQQTLGGVPAGAYQPIYSGSSGSTTDANLPDNFAGTATIVSTSSPPQPLAAVVNEVGPGGQFSSYDAVTVGQKNLQLPVALNNAYGGFYTGIGIQETSGTGGTVTVTYYDHFGNATQKPFQIAANGYLGLYQGDINQGPAPGAYTANISSTVPVAAIVNEVAPKASNGAQQSTSYNAFAGGASAVNLPLVESSGADGWSTGIGIMNTGSSPTTVTVNYFDAATGSPVGTPQSMQLAPNAFWGLYQPTGGLPAGQRASAQVVPTGGTVAVICNESNPTSFMSYNGQ